MLVTRTKSLLAFGLLGLGLWLGWFVRPNAPEPSGAGLAPESKSPASVSLEATMRSPADSATQRANRETQGEYVVHHCRISVVDPENRPIAGATVEFVREPKGDGPAPQSLPTLKLQTGSDGYALLGPLAEELGPFRLRVEAPNHGRRSLLLVVVPESLEVVLRPALRITGTVGLTATGDRDAWQLEQYRSTQVRHGLPNAWVLLHAEEPPSSNELRTKVLGSKAPWSRDLVFLTQADAFGKFVFENVPFSEQYRVHAGKEGLATPPPGVELSFQSLAAGEPAPLLVTVAPWYQARVHFRPQPGQKLNLGAPEEDRLLDTTERRPDIRFPIEAPGYTLAGGALREEDKHSAWFFVGHVLEPSGADPSLELTNRFAMPSTFFEKSRFNLAVEILGYHPIVQEVETHRIDRPCPEIEIALIDREVRRGDLNVRIDGWKTGPENDSSRGIYGRMRVVVTLPPSDGYLSYSLNLPRSAWNRGEYTFQQVPMGRQGSMRVQLSHSLGLVPAPDGSNEIALVPSEVASATWDLSEFGTIEVWNPRIQPGQIGRFFPMRIDGKRGEVRLGSLNFVTSTPITTLMPLPAGDYELSWGFGRLHGQTTEPQNRTLQVRPGSTQRITITP